MNKRIILSIAGLILGLGVITAAVIYISGNSYRKQLPEYPDFKSVSPAVKDQITQAGRKAYFFPTAENIGNLGLIYHSCANYEKAGVCYQLAVKKSSKKEWIWNYYLGFLNLELGESKIAIENFTHVLENRPAAYQALFYIGQAWLNLGDKKNAENIFKRVAGLNNLIAINEKSNRQYSFPIQTYAQFRLARVYLSADQLDSAEVVLKQIITRQWTFGPAYRLLGDVYNKKGEVELGKKFVTRSSDLSDYMAPEDTLIDKIALISRSDKYILKQIDNAKMSLNFNWEYELCNHALKYLPDNKYLLANTVILFFTMGKNDEVLPLLDAHLKSYGDDFEEMLKMANLLAEKGFSAQAERFYQQAQKLQPDSPRLATWLYDHGKKEEAISFIKELIRKHPTDENTLTETMRIFLNSGEKQQAEGYLSQLKKLYPSNLEAQKATALIYQMEGNEKAGLTIFEELTKNGIKDMQIYKYLARYYLKNQLWEKAIVNFREVLQIFPNDPESLEGLGRLLTSCPETKLRNPVEGMEYSERAFINFRSNPLIRVSASRNIATASAILGEKQKASWYINQTMAMVQKGNFPPNDFISYFEVLKKQYNLN